MPLNAICGYVYYFIDYKLPLDCCYQGHILLLVDLETKYLY